jgi:LPXTG-motif cell wall-anchored protein
MLASTGAKAGTLAGAGLVAMALGGAAYAAARRREEAPDA